MRCWCVAGALLVRCWCVAGALVVCYWCVVGALLVRCWRAAGVLLVRCWGALAIVGEGEPKENEKKRDCNFKFGPLTKRRLDQKDQSP